MTQVQKKKTVAEAVGKNAKVPLTKKEKTEKKKEKRKQESQIDFTNI